MEIMKSKIYKTPEQNVVLLRMTTPLLAGSITEQTSTATEMSSGSFGARDNDFDEED